MFHFLFKGEERIIRIKEIGVRMSGIILGSFFNLSGVLRSGSVFGSGSGLVLLFWGVLSFSFVFDISNESTIMVGSVGHSLDATVRKVDPVGTCNERYFSRTRSRTTGKWAGSRMIFFLCYHCVRTQLTQQQQQPFFP